MDRVPVPQREERESKLLEREQRKEHEERSAQIVLVFPRRSPRHEELEEPVRDVRTLATYRCHGQKREALRALLTQCIQKCVLGLKGDVGAFIPGEFEARLDKRRERGEDALVGERIEGALPLLGLQNTETDGGVQLLEESSNKRLVLVIAGFSSEAVILMVSAIRWKTDAVPWSAAPESAQPNAVRDDADA